MSLLRELPTRWEVDGHAALLRAMRRNIRWGSRAVAQLVDANLVQRVEVVTHGPRECLRNLRIDTC